MLFAVVVRVAVAILVLASCVPCKGEQATAQAYEAEGVLRVELAKCAGGRECLAPCRDLIALPEDSELETCRVTFDTTGNGWVEADYLDMSVCVADDGGDVVVDDGWDTGDDGTSDDGTPPDDGSDDGTPPDDGSGSDSGSDSGSGTGSDTGSPPDDGGDFLRATGGTVLRARAAARL